AVAVGDRGVRDPERPAGVVPARQVRAGSLGARPSDPQNSGCKDRVHRESPVISVTLHTDTEMQPRKHEEDQAFICTIASPCQQSSPGTSMLQRSTNKVILLRGFVFSWLHLI